MCNGTPYLHAFSNNAHIRHLHELRKTCASNKDGNIGFDAYINTWILWIYRIYRRYIGRYFYMNINISKINKNTLKFMEVLFFFFLYPRGDRSAYASP